MMKNPKFKIYATLSGWLIPVEITKETEKFYYTKDLEGIESKISKNENSRKLFDNVWEAQDWINTNP